MIDAETAARVTIAQHQRDMDDRRAQEVVEEFTRRWGPDGKDDAARFAGDLHHLMTQLSIRAQRPFIEAAAEVMARQPLPPIVLKS